MSSVASTPPLSPQELSIENHRLQAQVDELSRQLAWFKKQVFGPKSEKQPIEIPGQSRLFEPNDAPASEPAEAQKRKVEAYQRGTGKKQRDDDCVSNTGLRFGPELPVEVVEHRPPELTGP